jgi:hypothetical protein
MPINEDASIQTASPWKCQIGEEIITDVAKVFNINAILLRYFNLIGATSSEIENYLLSTSKLGAVYYANRFWITCMNFLFTEMIIQRLMETYVTYSRS